MKLYRKYDFIEVGGNLEQLVKDPQVKFLLYDCSFNPENPESMFIKTTYSGIKEKFNKDNESYERMAQLLIDTVEYKRLRTLHFASLEEIIKEEGLDPDDGNDNFTLANIVLSKMEL